MRFAMGAIALALLCGSARADDPSTFDEQAIIDATFDPDPASTWSAYAAAVAGTRTGSGVAIGGYGRVALTRCGPIVTVGEASIRTGLSEVSLVHSASACFTPFHRVVRREYGHVAEGDAAYQEHEEEFSLLAVDHHLVWNALPTLSARRIVWNQPYTRERIGGAFTLVRLSQNGWALSAGRLRHDTEWFHQVGEAETRAATRHRIAFTVARIAHFSGDGAFTFGESGIAGNLWHVDVVRFERFPIIETPIRFDFSFGWKHVFDDLEGTATGGAVGDAGLWLDVGRVTASLRAERAYYDTLDGAVAKETRIDSELRHGDAQRSVRLTAFAAKTSLLFVDGSGELEYDPTIGVEAGLDWQISARFDARIGVGWARSFYSKIGDLMPTPTPAFEINAALIADLGR